VRTLEYTLPDGTTARASPEDVARAAENLLMDGTMVMDSKELQAHIAQVQANEARDTAIVRALVAQAVERGIVQR
jgi:hypothetical protein